MDRAGFKQNNSFEYYKGEREETAVLLHGWHNQAEDMRPLAQFLHRQEYSVLNYNYLTSCHRIETFSSMFREELQSCYLNGPILFLTHSMGSIVLRHTLLKMFRSELQNIQAIVMLGPPNRGANWAALADFGLSNNISVGGLRKDSATLQVRLPASPRLSIGIIAAEQDALVPLENSKFPEDDPMAIKHNIHWISLNCGHNDLKDPQRSGRLILNFFQKQAFDSDV